MYFRGVNLWSVLVAAVSTMVIGFLWYSPLLFARPWMILMGYDPDDKSKLDEMRKGAGKNYAIAFIAILISGWCWANLSNSGPARRSTELGSYRGMAWFREHRAVDGRIS